MHGHMSVKKISQYCDEIMCWSTKERSFDSCQGKRLPFFPKQPDQIWDPHILLVNRFPKALSQG
jgi:hypothetical protein